MGLIIWRLDASQVFQICNQVLAYSHIFKRSLAQEENVVMLPKWRNCAEVVCNSIGVRTVNHQDVFLAGNVRLTMVIGGVS